MMLFTPFQSHVPFRVHVPFREFHSSAACFQRPSHRLFGRIDWDKVESGLYAIVDPFDPDHILYISEYDYIIQVRVCQTNNKNLIVLATPEDKRSDHSQNSPTVDPFVKSIITGKQSLNAKRRSRGLSHLFSSPFLGWRVRKDGKDESMVQLTHRNVRTCVTKWYDVLSWWRRGSMISKVSEAERDTFARRCQHLFQHNGVQFLILYLKGCLFVINSFLGGKRLKRDQIPGKVKVRCTNGLPVILPLYARNGIRSGNEKFIHIWTSMTNMYKGIEGKYDKIDISSIVQLHPDYSFNPTFLAFTQFVRTVFWFKIKEELKGHLTVNFTIKTLFATSKAGPAHGNAVLGAPRDAFIWYNPDESTGISGNYILEWLKETGNDAVWKIFRTASKRYKLMTDIVGQEINKVPDPSFKPHDKKVRGKDGKIKTVPAKPKMVINANLLPVMGLGRLNSRENNTPRILGRLAPIYEPAGKIRIVAIIDYWTNAVLKPLHDWMFDILKVIPTDATFDQEGTLKSFVSKGYTDCWSIDLTAATDTIPLKLYQELLTPIIGTKMTELWSKLLVGRNFLHRFSPKTERDFSKGDNTYDLVRYGRGQPMGALSSWPSMALVHHALVQFAAFSAGGAFTTDANMSEFLQTSTHMELKYIPWFQDYLILGDDLVIFDEKVAKEYLRVSELLGVKVGMTKSFISDKGFVNFASQSFVNDINYSPISFKEFIGVDSLSRRAELSLRMVRRGWIDLASTKWIAPLVKTFMNNSRIWTKVQSELLKGKTHPIVSWILSALLVPGRRISSTGLPRVSIRAAISVMKDAVIWNKPIQDLEKLTSLPEGWAPIHKIVKGNVDTVYRDFLEHRKRLEYFGTWLKQTMSVEGEEILQIILHDQVKERMDKWVQQYRVPLKTIQVTFGLPNLQPHMVYLASDMTVDECVDITAKAMESLPNVPDYSDLDVISNELKRSFGHPDREVEAFAKLLRLVGNVEHLFSHTTPGIDRSKIDHQLPKYPKRGLSRRVGTP